MPNLLSKAIINKYLQIMENLAKGRQAEKPVQLYHGTSYPEEFLAAVKSGRGAPRWQSSTDVLKTITSDYDLTLTEAKNIPGVKGILQTYRTAGREPIGSNISRISTAGPKVAESFTKYPGGEVAHSLDYYVKTYKALKDKLGRRPTSNEVYDFRNGLTQKYGSVSNVQKEFPSRLRTPQGAVLELDVDPRALSQGAEFETQDWLNKIRSGELTQEEGIRSWSSQYQDIKVPWSGVKGARVLSKGLLPQIIGALSPIASAIDALSSGETFEPVMRYLQGYRGDI